MSTSSKKNLIPKKPQTVVLMADSKKRDSIQFTTRSLSRDIDRDKEWEELKNKQTRRNLHRRCMSLDSISKFDVTDDDIKELKGVFELGFGLDMKNEMHPKLKRAFPALEMYVAMNGQFNNGEKSRSSSLTSDSLLNMRFMIDPKEGPKKVKLKLKRWAQVVICAAHEASKSKQPEIKVKA
ncbi:hypothetical protein CTI12_AA212920 [Artemisia annua]|uniref:Uncharacterized protein n=1 Tax=Artemisia annua TaxID=35608 RepID=A0A2U1NXZ6_ARTAN|nr:hypothetical protein CTI12_AA212920 [Artemisia annua]